MIELCRLLYGFSTLLFNSLGVGIKYDRAAKNLALKVSQQKVM